MLIRSCATRAGRPVWRYTRILRGYFQGSSRHGKGRHKRVYFSLRNRYHIQREPTESISEGWVLRGRQLEPPMREYGHRPGECLGVYAPPLRLCYTVLNLRGHRL